MVPFCKVKLLLKHYLCHIYKILIDYFLEFWDIYEELTPSVVIVQTFCSTMTLRNSLFLKFHRFSTYNAIESPKYNGVATTRGCYLFCTCPSEGAVYFDGAT
jgi:hypothetical protein